MPATVLSMAEHAHQVPDKYGDVTAIYHPRMNSYGRRLMAAFPPILLAAGIIAFILYKRPLLPFMMILLLILVGTFFAVYSFLKPAIVVRTNTHILRGKMFGWQAVPLANIEHTVFAERLTPKKVVKQEEQGAKFISKGVPAMWAINDKRKRILRLDGRIWDAKNLRTIASDIAPQTTVYPKINVTQMAKVWPGLVTFNELHPGWRSALIAVVTAIVILAIALGFLVPDDVLRQYHLIP